MISNFDKYEFARGLLLGTSKSYKEKATKNAYAAVQRTFRYNHKSHATPIRKTCNIIKDFINQIDNMLIEINSEYEVSIQNKFDKEFSTTCKKIISTFEEYNIDCYYGQAQKWINITMKYLVLFNVNYNKFTPYFHVAIDNIVYKLAADILNIPKPTAAWSRMNENEYWEYQIAIRKAINNIYNRSLSPFDWEWLNWNINHRATEVINGR